MSEFTSLNFSGFPLASALTSQTLFSSVTPQFPYKYFNLIFYSEINPFVKVQKSLVSVFWGDGVYRFFWSLCSTLEVTPDRIIWLTSSARANCSHLCLQGRLQARSGKSNKSTKWWLWEGWQYQTVLYPLSFPSTKWICFEKISSNLTSCVKKSVRCQRFGKKPLIII